MGSFLSFKKIYLNCFVITFEQLQYHSFPSGLRQMLQDFVAQPGPDEGEDGGDANEQPNPNDMLEVQFDKGFLPELSAEEVESVLNEFDLTDYDLTECTLDDSPTPSSPSLQPSSSTYDKFATISKSLEGTESSDTNPIVFIDIVQQALCDPSVFGTDDFDLTF